MNRARTLGLAACSAFIVARAAEPSTPRDRLISRPPFGAIGGAQISRARSPGAAPGATELRGIFGAGETGAASLSAVGGNAQARWLKVGESFGAWRVLSVDAAKREAVVEIGGRATTLTLAKPEIRAPAAKAPAGPTTSGAARADAGAVTPPPPAPAKATPATTPAEPPAGDDPVAAPEPDPTPKPAGTPSRRRRYSQPETPAP